MKTVAIVMLLINCALPAFTQSNRSPIKKADNTSTRSGTLNATKNKMKAATTASPSTPFASGIYAAPNAAKTFDTLKTKVTAENNRFSPLIVSDTTFNARVQGTSNPPGTQFGQTNWGDGRGTVGASQWTVPPPITYSFKRDYPAAENANWSRNATDTSIFSARYKADGFWVTSDYNLKGERVGTSTEMPVLQPPAVVRSYIAQQPAGFKDSVNF